MGGMSSILVVDDDADICRLMVRVLQRLGYEAASETSGPAALARVEARKPDVILLDVMMPEMNGLEVLRRLRNDQGTAAIPVIMFSALADEQYQADARKLGAIDYWVKASIDLNQIIYRLSRLLPVQ
jgi:CheY-like chemotaxis protein